MWRVVNVTCRHHTHGHACARAHTQVCDGEAEQAVTRPSFPWNAVVLVLHPRDPGDALISALAV